MGAAIAERLLAQGPEVVVWNRTAGRTGPWRRKGCDAASRRPSSPCRGGVHDPDAAGAIEGSIKARTGSFAGEAPAGSSSRWTVGLGREVARRPCARRRGVFVECGRWHRGTGARRQALSASPAAWPGTRAGHAVLKELCRGSSMWGPSAPVPPSKLALQSADRGLLAGPSARALALMPRRRARRRAARRILATHRAGRTCSRRGRLVAKAIDGEKWPGTSTSTHGKDIRPVDEAAALGSRLPRAEQRSPATTGLAPAWLSRRRQPLTFWGDAQANKGRMWEVAPPHAHRYFATALVQHRRKLPLGRGGRSSSSIFLQPRSVQRDPAGLEVALQLALGGLRGASARQRRARPGRGASRVARAFGWKWPWA
jgi:hypothetical protein